MASSGQFGERPGVKTRDEYLARWSELHGNVNPHDSWLIRGWLTFAYRIARPLTKLGITPNGVTVVGVLVALFVPLLAWLGTSAAQSWVLWVAVLVVVLSGLLDNLDGAVAVITGRTTRGGYVLDSVADRVSDAALLCALWVLGAPGWVVASAVFVSMIQEYARARAGVVGIDEVGVVSISERPTRIVIVAVFTGLAAWGLYGVPVNLWATVGAWAAFLVAVVGFGQVGFALARRLRD